MSGGGSTQTGSQTTQLDPDMKNAWLSMYGQANQSANSHIPTQGVANFTPTGVLGQDMAVNAAGAGQGTLNNAVGTASDVATGGGTVTSQSTPDSAIMGFRNVQAPQFSQASLTPFMNPYTNDVVNSSLNDIELQRQRGINSNSSNSTLMGGEGAWGGSRAGVSDALTNEAALRQAADTSANLRSQGFGQALGAAQNYAGMGMQADQANQQADLTRGSTVYGGTLATNFKNIDSIAANQDRRLAAAGLLGQLGGQQQGQALTGAAAVQDVGQQQYDQQQKQLSQQYQDLYNQLMLPLQMRESAFGIIPTTANGGSTSSTQSVRQSPGLLGILGTGLSAASLFASDRRLKTAIRPLGQDRGRNWYAYRYHWDAPSVERIGVMAQENPDIAVRHASGFDFVDYGRIAA